MVEVWHPCTLGSVCPIQSSHILMVLKVRFRILAKLGKAHLEAHQTQSLTYTWHAADFTYHLTTTLTLLCVTESFICMPFPRGKIPWIKQRPVTRRRGSKSRGMWDPAVDHPKFQIQWLSAPFHTQKVINHLCDHLADCWILFSSDAKQPQNDGDHPLGKDKLSVCALIMRHVFQNDAEYVRHYVDKPDKFRDSTNSYINGYIFLTVLLNVH